MRFLSKRLFQFALQFFVAISFSLCFFLSHSLVRTLSSSIYRRLAGNNLHNCAESLASGKKTPETRRGRIATAVVKSKRSTAATGRKAPAVGSLKVHIFKRPKRSLYAFARRPSRSSLSRAFPRSV